MRPIWDCMHAEFLYVFDTFFSKDKGWHSIDAPLRFVSRLDMCESCEKLVFSRVLSVKNIGNYGSKDYKILVESYCGYGNSRTRHQENTLLLKVALCGDQPERCVDPNQ